jgi:RNA-directed DNA polymerase
VPNELKSLSSIPIYKGSSLNDGAEVKLYGYPNHVVARPVRVEAGKIIRNFPKSGVSYFEITPKIIGGNSGGPLLTAALELVGIAVLGVNGSTALSHAEFLAVNASELGKLDA